MAVLKQGPQLHGAFLRGRGHQQFAARIALAQQLAGGHQARRQLRHLRGPAARQQGDDRGLCGQPQIAPGLRPVRHTGQFLNHRMADKAGVHVQRAIQRGLEGKQAQQAIDGPRDLVHTPRTPGPDRGADQVRGAHTGIAQAPRQSQIEVRRVDAEQQRRRVGAPAPVQRAADTQQFGQATEGFDQAHNGQALQGVQGVKALGDHRLAADALGVQGTSGQGALERTQHTAAEHIAGGLAGYQGDTPGGAARLVHHSSISARCRARKRGSNRSAPAPRACR